MRLCRKLAVLVVLGTGAILEGTAGEAKAQVVVSPAYETVYVPTPYRVKMRGYRPRRGVAMVPTTVVAPTVYTAPVATAYAPTVYSSPVSTVVSETRYVTSPVVRAQYVETAPVVTRRYVPAPVVESAVYGPTPVFERQYIVVP